MPKMRVNGVDLYYEVHGEGQPLIFINGLGSSGRDWEQQVPEFAKFYKVVTFDLRGQGQSDKPQGPYTMATFAADTAGLLQALGAAPAHVVGLSLGGGIAFQLAVDTPALLRTMTIVNSAPEMVLRTFKDRVNVWQRFAIVRLLGMRRMGQVLGGRLFPKPEQDALRTTFVERWAENDPKAYTAAMRAMVGWSVTDRLGSIQCPALVIAADMDYTPLAVKEAYVKLMPHAELAVITDAHHATPVEEPAKFNAVLREFLAKSSA
jgi:3-oxoadipate enol-lactonase